MNIDFIKVGYLETNCYILTKGKDTIIIDPGDDFDYIKNRLNGLNLLGVIVTHHHPDHVGALEEVLEHYKVKLYDFHSMKEGINNIGDFSFDVIYTPGHTDDSITIYFKEEKVMFVGDFIFKGSIGRTDLGGNIMDMRNSIERIKKYPNVIIYPGHRDKTTLDEEKKTNIYFQ